MATNDKSLTPDTLVDHVETRTASTREPEKPTTNFSDISSPNKEDGEHNSKMLEANAVSIPTPQVQVIDNTGVEVAPAPPDSLGDEAVGKDPTTPTILATKEGNEETRSSKASTVSSTIIEANLPSSTERRVAGEEMQRSKSEGEVEISSINPSAPAIPSGTTENNRKRIGSVDDDDHLQEILTSQNLNNQIVERSPGERYVRFSEKLGSGASKDVYRAYDTEEGIEVAWNVVHLAGVPKNERNRIVNEVRLLERLHHQNIISFHGSWINREQQQVNFVTEILSSGTLKSFINKVQVIRWKIAKRWAVQILKGLEYLHSQEPPVIHRDLKCENIFINGTSGDLRIGDLGLSTVHRNGKALSVLGTPEFMAPDMYEEGSYDERVDIYAFGMCLLEIFTKEIPYKECNNPAQIYKKVTRGAPPDSLSRLKSVHAREFIELCLGYRNHDGKYVRPNAKELLEHPFLVKRATDDEEVEVDPPLQEQSIIETVTRSGGRSSTESKGINASNSGSAGTSKSYTNTTPTKEGSHTRMPTMRQNSLEEDESDRFEEMPESEVNNMKKVKVMMGRGEELKEDDEVQAKSGSNKHEVTEAISSNKRGSNTSVQKAKQTTDTSGKNFLVAAAVIEGSEQNGSFQQQQPYHDDVLKLMITLPVEGETQNVQFDFHLVEDDPIQVAKEMVAELGIPGEAVLEISETISGLARVARTKKHKLTSGKPQQNPGHARNNSVVSTRSAATPPVSQVGQTAVAQQQQHLGQTMMQPVNQQQQPLQEYIPSQQQSMQQASSAKVQQPIPQQSLPIQEQSLNIHGQQVVENSNISSQMQHIQQPRPNVHNTDTEAHRHAQVSYLQGGVEVSQLEAQTHNHEPQINGEYHHQGHVSSERKHSRAPYVQTSLPPPIPAMPVPTVQAPTSHSQISQQRGPQQGHTPHDTQSPATAYTQSATNQVSSQFPPSLVQPSQGHLAQSVGTGQQTVSSSLQQAQHIQNQQMHSASQGLAQGFTQHQQVQTSIQHGQTLPQQQLVQQPVQQMQNIAQQHLTNEVQASQPPPIQVQLNRRSSLPQQQQLQQQVTNQQHQLQGGVPQQIDHRQQQQPLTQQLSTHPHQQQTHVSNYHMPSPTPSQGQRTSSGSNPVNLQAPKEKAAALEFLPVVQQKESSRFVTQNGSLASKSDNSTATNSQTRIKSMEHQEEDSSQGGSTGVLEGLSIDTSGEEDPADEVRAAELRKLDQDFENNLKRAKKVFVARMDNLQRTQVQREAQHQKTLEQHQKDRTAFEKRLQQEEIEQNRRIEQMQKEWDRRREEVRSKDKA